jgi:hypothetical protein
MSAKKTYWLLLGAVGLSLIALIVCVIIASNLLASQSRHLVKARTESMVLEGKQEQLAKAKSDISKYKDLADIAKSIVPQDKDQAQTVREIVNLAAANGVKLGSITFPTSALGDAKVTHSQLTPVQNIPGVYRLEITVQSDSGSPATYTSFINFLDALEHNRRTALVSGITLTPESNDPNKLAFTLIVNEYIKP